MARLHTRRKTDGGHRIVAMPQVANPETLAGMVVPIDPQRIRKLPGISLPQDIALTVALTGLVLLGRPACAAADLARICGMKEADLPIALARACGRKGDGSPKFFRAEMTLDGTVTVAVIMNRILRPERYVRLDVESLAAAPTASHARFYALAAEATIGDETKGTNIVNAPIASVGLDAVADPDEQLLGLVDWTQPLFGDATAGWVLSAGIHEGAVHVMAVNSCNWIYDHRAAPRPWTDDTYWERTRLQERDGQWEGIDLTVDPVRAAKVCAWMKRKGSGLGERSIRDHWLFALRNALIAARQTRDVPQLLDSIRTLGASGAFERWVITNVVGLDAPTFAVGELAEEARALRRISAANPKDPGLRPYGRDPITAEEICYLQFCWRVTDRLDALYKERKISKWEYDGAIEQQKTEYQVGGRMPKPLPIRRPPLVSHKRLKAAGVAAFNRFADPPAALAPAARLAVDMVVAAMVIGTDYDTIDELTDGSLEWVMEGSHWRELCRSWATAQQAAAVADGTSPLGHDVFVRMAKEIFREVVAATEE